MTDDERPATGGDRPHLNAPLDVAPELAVAPQSVDSDGQRTGASDGQRTGPGHGQRTGANHGQQTDDTDWRTEETP